MKRKLTTKRQQENPAFTVKQYRIIDETGKEVSSFVLTEENPRVMLNISLPGASPETVLKRLEREAWASHKNAMAALRAIDAIDSSVAREILMKMSQDAP